VGTRLRKVAEQPGLTATILAAAGLHRLGFELLPHGELVDHQPARNEPARPGDRPLSGRAISSRR